MVSRYILLLFSFLALQASAKQAFNEEEDEDDDGLDGVLLDLPFESK